MCVTHCFSGGEEYPSEQARERMIHGRNPGELPNKSISLIRTVGGLCNAAVFDTTTLDRPIHAVKVIGDPTDQAILRLAQTLGPVQELHSQWKKLFEIPFNSKNKYMACVFTSTNQQEAGYVILADRCDDLELSMILDTFSSRVLQICFFRDVHTQLTELGSL